ncbi:hypothetical protein [Lysinibacillus sp. JK80]|uniref:hypothetical protein n=1 Tax=Lysinibacillus sp. JK80 TaxID=2749809 RepID=UPI0022B9C377|nr:hypothetical protein [Lysinibacillus sp. JK80]
MNWETKKQYVAMDLESQGKKSDVTEGILAEECGQILTDFFKALRDRKKAEKKARLASNDINGH